MSVNSMYANVRELLDRIPEQDRVKYIQDNAYLGILVDEEKIFNPFREIPKVYEDRPELFFAYMMSRPEYVYFFAKYIMNVNLFPFQCAVLNSVWYKKFPILISSRGFSKCSRDAYVCLDDRFVMINDLFEEDDPYEEQIPRQFNVLGEKGFHKNAYIWKKKPGETVKISTSNSYSLEGSKIHPIRVVSNGEIVWKELKDVVLGDYVVLDRNQENHWHSGNAVEPDMAYLIGSLLGDGCLTSKKKITFTSGDVESGEHISELSVKYFGKPFNKSRTKKYDYVLHSVPAKKMLRDVYGVKLVTAGYKEVPPSIFASSREAVIAFLQGMCDTDGSATSECIGVDFNSKSLKLMKGIQFLLSRLGIISTLHTDFNKKRQEKYYKIRCRGESAIKYAKEVGFRLTRKQKTIDEQIEKSSRRNGGNDVIPKEMYLTDFIKLRQKFSSLDYIGRRWGDKPIVANYDRRAVDMNRTIEEELSYVKLEKMLEVFGRSPECKASKEYANLQKIFDNNYYFAKIDAIEKGFNELYDFYFDEDDHSYISSGFISHNSYTLGFYALMRAALLPARKIVIVASGFRSSKLVYEYAERFYSNAPVFQSLCKKGQGYGSRKDPDSWVFNINDSYIKALPIGDGGKIRGSRAHDILIDELHSTVEEIINQVIAPFMAVSSDPMSNVKEHAMRKFAEVLGITLENESEKDTYVQPNQLFRSGTAYYRFNHFFRVFDYYRDLIRTKGEPERLAKVAQRRGIDGKINLDPKNLCILRIPFEMIPEGFMDQQAVEEAKSMGHHSSFLCEYAACPSGDTQVVTPKGLWNIASLSVGDLVMTHKGRYRQVTKITHRLSENILRAETELGVFRATADHPIWTDGDNFIPFGEADCLKFPQETELIRIDLLNYISGYLQTRDNTHIYPTHDGCTLDIAKQKEIREDTRKVSEIAKTYNTSPANIRLIKGKDGDELPKGSVLKNIRLSYELGYLLACYMYRKQIGAKGRQLSFYFKDNEKEFIQKSKQYLEKVFDFEVKKYPYRATNATRVAVNSTIIVDFFKTIFEKDMWHSLLNNVEIIQGFKEGLSVGTSRHPNNKYEQITNIYKSFNFPIKNNINNKELIKYDDLVYNLEVDEDNSYVTEFGAVHNCFPKDSTGFFSRLSIEEATASPENLDKDNWPVDVPVFKPCIQGNPDRNYVMGIDPASEYDNFAIQILEVHPNHRRHVYSFTTKRSEFKQQAKGSGLSEEDFYAYCCGKIVQLCKDFNIVRLGIDKLGGGVPIITGLQNSDVFSEKERIYPAYDPKKKQDTDGLNGNHILEEIYFARSEWVMASNHTLRSHIEKKVLIFPHVNGADVAIAMAADYEGGQERLIYDGMESCVLNIEETKNELSQIVQSSTAGTGREKFDTPDTIVKRQGQTDQKGKMRKDRYSSLLIANYTADQYLSTLGNDFQPLIGGFVKDGSRNYFGPAHFQGNQKVGNKMESLHKAILGN